MPDPLIDLSTLERLFKGDRERVEVWLRLYLEEVPSLFVALTRHLEAGDVHGLSIVAHELRPQAHYLGAPRLLECLLALGEQAQRGDAVSCSGLVCELIALGVAVENEVRTALGKGVESREEPV